MKGTMSGGKKILILIGTISILLLGNYIFDNCILGKEDISAVYPKEPDDLEGISQYYGYYKISQFWPYDDYDALKYDRLPLEEADMMLGRIVEIRENMLLTCDSFRSLGSRGGREAFTRNYTIEMIAIESPCYEWEEFTPDTAWYEAFSEKYYYMEKPEDGIKENIAEQYYQGIEGKISVRVAGPIAGYYGDYEYYHEYYVKEDGMIMHSGLTGNCFYLEKLDGRPDESVRDQNMTEEEKEAVLQSVLGIYTITEFLPTKFYPGLDSAGDEHLPKEEAYMMLGKEIIMESDLYGTYDNGRWPNSEFRNRKMDEFILSRIEIKKPEYRIEERCRDDIYGLRDDMLPEGMVQDTYLEIKVYPGFSTYPDSTLAQDREQPQLYLLDDGRLIMYAMSEYFLLEKHELFYMITEEGEAVITGGYTGEDILIPTEIDGILVAGIGEGAFRGRTDIKKVVVEQGVRYITADAFAGCTEIEGLELGEGLLYIGEGAFSSNTKISEVILPDSVAYVGEYAFAECTNLEEISFPQRAHVDAYAFVQSAWQKKRDEGGLFIRGSCFMGIGENQSSTLEFPYGITKTPDFSEKDAALIRRDIRYEEIILPETLVELGRYCFSGTQIQRIHLPEGLKTIPEGIFEEAVLGEVILPPELARIEMCAFKESTIMETRLPDTLVFIGERAFWGSEVLKKIEIPASVRYVGENAFGGCSSIEEVVLEEGLLAVAGDAFSGVDAKRIQFPESLLSIYGYGPSPGELERIYIPERTDYIDERFWKYFKQYGSFVVVYGQSGSLAEKAAKENGLEFVPVANGNEMP